MSNEDPFELWSQDDSAPKEDEQHRHGHILFSETHGADGEVDIQIFPSPMARTSAAFIAGQFKALLDTKVFTREEAFRVVLKSMSAVVVHHDHGDDDNDDD